MSEKQKESPEKIFNELEEDTDILTIGSERDFLRLKIANIQFAYNKLNEEFWLIPPHLIEHAKRDLQELHSILDIARTKIQRIGFNYQKPTEIITPDTVSTSKFFQPIPITVQPNVQPYIPHKSKTIRKTPSIQEQAERHYDQLSQLEKYIPRRNPEARQKRTTFIQQKTKNSNQQSDTSILKEKSQNSNSED